MTARRPRVADDPEKARKGVLHMSRGSLPFPLAQALRCFLTLRAKMRFKWVTYGKVIARLLIQQGDFGRFSPKSMEYAKIGNI